MKIHYLKGDGVACGYDKGRLTTPILKTLIKDEVNCKPCIRSRAFKKTKVESDIESAFHAGFKAGVKYWKEIKR